jgi:polyribonucleotide nucleotidyltransferase
MIEGGEDFDDNDGPEEEGEEINFNRADGVPVPVNAERRPSGPGGPGGGPGGQQRRRRRRGRRPGGPGGGSGGGRGPQ